MYNYSIMGLIDDHVEEVCTDVLEQYRTGVADMALFKMTLVPEGDPPIDKAAIMCETYDKMRDRLARDNASCGILVQASIGHGYPLNRMFPFQRVVRFTDGEEINVVCPYDEEFRAFFKNQMRTLASHRPALIMLDDDFRLLGRAGIGCACPHHMRAFNERAGTNYTREELREIILSGTPEGDRLREIFVDVQRDSLVGAAKMMREGIDEVDPSIPGVYCCVSGEFEYEIAREMAGKDHPVIIRINNGRYTPAGARELTSSMIRAAYQINTASGPVDAFLAETDTCPQNRYSTSAHSLHSHFTGTILEGASGAKHWITRLGAFEPASGKAYRKLLAKNSGFYHALSEIAPQLSPLGCRIPLPKHWQCYFDTPYDKVPIGFPVKVLERLGLPMYFSSKPGGAVFLSGPADRDFSDDELRAFFTGPVFMDSIAASRLIKRGFGKFLGVDVHEWHGRHLSGELLPNGNACNAQVRAMELVPTSPDTRADSTVFHIPDGKTREPLFPGVTVFRNELGGMSVVFCGDPNTNFTYMEAFSFLNESRKSQMVNLLREAGTLPVYVDTDAEVYLRAANMSDGTLFAGVFNIGLDPLDDIPLMLDRPVTAVEYLSPDGKRLPCEISGCEKQDNGMYAVTVYKAAGILDPVILFLK